MMSEEKTLIMLLVVAGLIALIYFIYKAVQDNKQVVMLAPTTILVDQHYKTFKNNSRGRKLNRN